AAGVCCLPVLIPVRDGLRSGFVACAELGLSYPITKHVRLYTQVYSGYGESLIDYNFNQTRVGVGVMLNDLF
ncbi:phospholipase A, partial [Escherichia coli]|nr:phospholipase A [Escherichia coli]